MGEEGRWIKHVTLKKQPLFNHSLRIKWCRPHYRNFRRIFVLIAHMVLVPNHAVLEFLRGGTFHRSLFMGCAPRQHLSFSSSTVFLWDTQYTM